MSATSPEPSLVKARYAAAIIKNAKGTERRNALRLILSVIDDCSPTPGESAEADRLHQDTLSKFADLAEALSSSRDAAALWYPAERAAQNWVNLLEERS